LTQVNQMTQES